jgi:hypothetical protein
MRSKYVTLAALVIASSVLTRAQAPQQEVIKHFTDVGGFTGGGVTVEGAEGYMNSSTGQIDFVGPVSVRPTHVPLTVEIPATNAGGALFPPVEPIVMHFRGPFEVTIDHFVLRADEADVDARTGKMELRGNVRAVLQR